MLWRLYRRLWHEAEADRRLAEGQLREHALNALRLAAAAREIGNLMLVFAESHPDAAIRGEARKAARKVGADA